MSKREMLGVAAILVLFCPALFLADSDLPVAACCSECRCSVSDSGECSLSLREECGEGTCLRLDLDLESSIVDLEMRSPSEAELRISELDRASQHFVLLETRRLGPGTHRYRSRSSTALLCFSGSPPMTVDVSFRELEYRRLRPSVSGGSLPFGEAEVEYVPNSVTLLQLPEEPGDRWKGMEVWVWDLEVDVQGGEYLLVGAGSGEDVPARFVSEVPGCTASFYVAGGSAFLEFAAGPALKKRHAFTISWNRTGAEVPSSISPYDSLNAVLVCFFNYSLDTFQVPDALTRLGSMEEAGEAFRQAFADSVNNYTDGKADCYKSSVHLLGHPTEVPGALSVLLALECGGRTFKYQELRSMLHAFRSTLGFQVGPCPSPAESGPYVERWSTLVYALVPAFGLCILLVWAWKNDIFGQRCGPQMEEEEDPPLGLESSPLPAEPNTYEQTIPKVCLDDGHGRRQTLVQGSTWEDAGCRGRVSSPPSDTLLQALSGRRSRHRPSLRALGGDESNHVYDSVSSSKAMDETKL